MEKTVKFPLLPLHRMAYLFCICGKTNVMQKETTRHAHLNGHPAEASETLYRNLFIAPTGLLEEDDDLEDDEDLEDEDELDLDDEAEASGVETDNLEADVDAADLDEDDLDLDDDEDEEDEL
jgi:hypothetical protein